MTSTTTNGHTQVEPAHDAPKLRGAAMVGAIETIRELWGEEVFRAALAKLTPEDRDLIESKLLASSFYPIESWDRFLDAVYAEVKLRTGESIEEFYARLVRLGGGRILRLFYKMFLGIMRPTMVAKLVPSFWMRLYTSGKLDITVNEPGHCVFRFTDNSGAYRKNVVNHLPPGVALLLGENGAQNVKSTLTKNELVAGRLTIEVTTTYDA